ncbi:MAG: prepilin-type N-terminal cleavage/methylation domain-containing protein [Actinomycetales bacterium]
MKKDQGFTLIELLVVIIIIGILAAIAIPVFLNQRQKGWDAQAKSDLRNMATAEATYLTEELRYTDDVSRLELIGFKGAGATTDHTATALGGNLAAGYCLSVLSNSGTTWYASSEDLIPSDVVKPNC